MPGRSPHPVEFVGRLRDGDEVAWTQLYDELAGPVGGYARSKGVADPDDLIGDVFAAAAERIHDFDGGSDALRSWIFTIAHHRLADDLRRRNRRATDAAAPQTFEDLGEDDDAASAVVDRVDAEGALGLLDELTGDQRDVIVLRILGGLSVVETAEVLGRAPGAIKALQHRAIARLQRRIGHEPYPDALRSDDTNRDRS